MFTSSTFHCWEAAYYIHTEDFFTGTVVSILEKLYQYNTQMIAYWWSALRKDTGKATAVFCNSFVTFLPLQLYE